MRSSVPRLIALCVAVIACATAPAVAQAPANPRGTPRAPGQPAPTTAPNQPSTTTAQPTAPGRSSTSTSPSEPPLPPLPEARSTTNPPATTPAPPPSTGATPSAPSTSAGAYNPYAANIGGAGAMGAGTGGYAPFGGAGGTSGDFGSLEGLSAGGSFQMIGDLGPAIATRQVTPAPPGVTQPFPPHGFPTVPNPRLASALAPSVRGFKIAENQSPQPQDRFFFTFDFFANANAALDRRFGAPVDNLRIYRYIFGFEKTFNEGRGSFGAVLPLDTLSANSTIQGNFNKPGGTSTSLDDPSFFVKYIIQADPATGSLLSTGLLVTVPTAQTQFAGAKFFEGVNSTSIQPFLGYIIRRDRFYFHGFSAISVPSSLFDVTMVYNDLGIGYFVYSDPAPDAFLTAIAPTFEVHVNDPLTHRDVFNSKDISGTADIVNLTYGVNVEFSHRSVLTFAVANPVTGPRPFDYEILVLLNVRFGRSARAPRANLPIAGG